MGRNENQEKKRKKRKKEDLHVSYFKVFPKFICAFTSKLQIKQAFNDESRLIVCI